ncbi:MAG: acyl-CoA reductase [Bacteroidota bacterium]|nr:acyl-CoA reductase [Bacteroidota bacterium]
MILSKRIELFVSLGKFFKDFIDNTADKNLNKRLSDAIQQAKNHNNYFTEYNIINCLKNWSYSLQKEKIKSFLSTYIIEDKKPKSIAIIMAGNVPLVGFHDFLCVILSGNKAVIKLSSKDSHLMHFVLNYLSSISIDFKDYFEICQEKLSDYDAVIATGNNLSASKFEEYFNDYPNIIRKSRHSVAILKGDESNDQLQKLSNDIFNYFGLGCRNVSKVYLPKNYDLDLLFKSFIIWKKVINNNSYANNYDYHRAVYLLNKEVFFDNGFILLKESKKIGSPVGTLFYEYYDKLEDIEKSLSKISEKIQCVVSNKNIENFTEFGKTQSPELTDYADGVDTIDFLLKLN